MAWKPIRPAAAVLVLGLAALLTACSGEQPEQTAAEQPSPQDHHHVAPRGGMLVEVGEHQASLEIVVDPGTGRLTIFVLDGCAENTIRLAQPAIKVTVILPPAPDEVSAEAHVATLAAVANPLTGETVGDTAEFTALVPELVGAQYFAGVVGELEIRGTSFTGVDFYYPEDLAGSTQAPADPEGS
jgi:hypothetical protein